MKHFAVLVLVFAVFLAGCSQGAAQRTDSSAMGAAELEYPFYLNTLEEYQNSGPPSDDIFYPVYPRNFVFYEDIRSLGDFAYYGTYTHLDGHSSYWYGLVDGNNVTFELYLVHFEPVSFRKWEFTDLPSDTKSMAQINMDNAMESDDIYTYIKSNGLIYEYVNGQLDEIHGAANGIYFHIDAKSSTFPDYPEEGERTLLSLLLSADSKDQQEAKWMLQRCFPKTWVHYAVYCGIALVAVAAALGAFFVIRARRAKRKAASACAAPDDLKITEASE